MGRLLHGWLQAMKAENKAPASSSLLQNERPGTAPQWGTQLRMVGSGGLKVMHSFL